MLFFLQFAGVPQHFHLQSGIGLFLLIFKLDKPDATSTVKPLFISLWTGFCVAKLGEATKTLFLGDLLPDILREIDADRFKRDGDAQIFDNEHVTHIVIWTGLFVCYDEDGILYFFFFLFQLLTLKYLRPGKRYLSQGACPRRGIFSQVEPFLKKKRKRIRDIGVYAYL